MKAWKYIRRWVKKGPPAQCLVMAVPHAYQAVLPCLQGRREHLGQGLEAKLLGKAGGMAATAPSSPNAQAPANLLLRWKGTTAPQTAQGVRGRQGSWETPTWETLRRQRWGPVGELLS